MSNIRLSKSKIMQGLQCQKMLWLTIHKPELAEMSQQTNDILQGGLHVHEVFRGLYPDGILIDGDNGLGEAIAATSQHLSEGVQRLFEATFEHEDVLIRADLLEKSDKDFCVFEAKSSTSVKDYHLQDAAIQYWVIAGNNLPIKSFHISYINNQFVYPGNSDYQGLFAHENITSHILSLVSEVPDLVKICRKTLSGPEPAIAPGCQCSSPWDCPYAQYCSPPRPEEPYAISTLPGSRRVVEELQAEGYTNILQVPVDRLRLEKHIRIWNAVHNQAPQVSPELPEQLKAMAFPRYYLDFETIGFAVPIWEGTRPYQQIPFQYSIHKQENGDQINSHEFLEIDGKLQIRHLADQMIHDLGASGPILIYSPFERRMIRLLIDFLPDLKPSLEALLTRTVDLLALMRRYYYHPAMAGSWSIKTVLPAIAPDLSYDKLDEVNNGIAAQSAFLEAIHPDTTGERRESLRKNMLTYCGLDTLGMLRIVQHFT
ncbi:MAG: DUF2779 domain-containing protein [Candidatus Riflebacteria bacterium]|nr:DUF2779 domain-containing protein [Candidatus Riflebacteria bacterium]